MGFCLLVAVHAVAVKGTATTEGKCTTVDNSLPFPQQWTKIKGTIVELKSQFRLNVLACRHTVVPTETQIAEMFETGEVTVPAGWN